MNKYHIELEVLTPLSVGAGNNSEWIPGADFVQKDGMIYVLDIQKAAAAGIDLGKLTDLFVKSDGKGICNLLGNKLEQCSKYVFKKPASSNNPIKSFLRTQFYDLPVVAGSSLKGSIRSALFKSLRSPNEQDNVSVFGSMNNGTDFMRFIQVSDFEMPTTILVNSKLFNLRGKGTDWQGGWKHAGTKDGDPHTDGEYSPQGFNTLYECVEPGQKGYGSIVLATKAYDLLEHSRAIISHIESKHELINANICELFKVINHTTRTYLTKEKQFFNQYPAQRTDEIVSNIDYLLSLIPTDGSSCLLKMSAGVGFHSVTGDWQYDNYDETGIWEEGKHKDKKKYKSRKTVEYKGRLMLMGFVRLRNLTRNEVETVSENLQAKHQTIIENILAPIKNREEALLQAEEERRIKKEARIKEEQIRNYYQQLMQEAKELHDGNRLDEAIAKAEKAAELLHDNMEALSLIEQCRSEKISQDFLKGQDDDKKKKFEQPLSVVLQGKTSVGNIVGTTATWMKYHPNPTFGEGEYLALIACLQGKSAKEIKGKRKELEKAIEKEWTDKIIAALNAI